MPQYPIDVVIDPSRAVSGGKRVEGALKDIESTASRVQSLLNRALAFTGVSFGVSSLVTIVDEWTNYQNRVRSVTKSQAEFNTVQEQLFQISQRTRSALDANAVLYQRTADGIKRQGFSLRETLQFIEAYNQALVLGGGAAKEANAATIQFAQGLGTGVLRGEELNSVMEQSAVVADIIAAQFGVSRGELKKLGEQGKLTSQQIIQGFLKAREELQDRFSAMVPTISQSFQVLRNSIVRVIGTYDQGAGASRIFSESIIALADNLDNIIRIMGAAVMVVGTYFAAQAIPKAIAGVQMLTAAMAANPLGALLISISAVISLLVVFSDKIAVTNDGMATLRDLGVVAWESIKEAFSSFMDFFNTHFAPIAELAREVFKDVNFSIEDTLRFTAKAVDMFLGLWKAAFNVVKVLFEQIPLIIQKAFAEGINAAASGVESVVNSLISNVNSLRGSLGMEAMDFIDFDRVGLDLKEPAADLGKLLGDAASEGFNITFAQDSLNAGLERAKEVASERRKLAAAQEGGVDMDKKSAASTTALDGAKKKLKITFEQLYDALVREGEALKFSNAEREIALGLNRLEEQLKRKLTESETKRAEEQLRLNQQLQIQADLFDQIKGPITKYKDTVAGLNALLEKGRINQEEYNLALSQTQLTDQLKGVRTDLSLDPEAGKLQALQDSLTERQMILRQAREAELISEQEHYALSLEATRRYNQGVMDIENERYRMQLQIGASAFESLAGFAKTYAGGQSKLYTTLFRISKAFAVADATMQVTNAIAKAANSGPFPYNLGAIAAVASATANLVSSIQGVNMNVGSFQNGGSFRVGGSGGTDSQMVSFRASPNETVTIRTPGQEKAANKETTTAPAAAPQMPPIFNVIDQNVFTNLLNTPAGRGAFINFISADASAINQALGR